jgi:hypothetical protein
MKLDEAKRAAESDEAGRAICERVFAEDVQTRVNDDEETLVSALSRCGGLDVVAAWVQWQAAGGVDAQTARESLERAFRAVAEAAMDGYAPAEA